MANITLMGASYTDVPAVTLPQTGGGTVTFYENGGGVSRETIVPATTVSVTAGGWARLTTGTTPSLVEGEYYAYTINGVERVATATLANGNIYLTDILYDWGGNSFAIGYDGSGILFSASATSGEYTVKVDKLTLSGGGGANQDYEDALVALGVQSDLADSIYALTAYSNGVTGESDTTLSDAVHTLGSGYGGSDQSLIKSADLTMSETYTNNNKLTVALEARNACVILVWADELPSAPESGYTAIAWTFFIASGISQTRLGRILRANGTVGNDDSMASFNTTTGELSLGGQYGYFREGMTYHIRQYEF